MNLWTLCDYITSVNLELYFWDLVLFNYIILLGVQNFGTISNFVFLGELTF